MSKVELTLKDRLVLANQYEILAALKPEDADHYNWKREIVERGYELDYKDLVWTFDSPGLSEEQCREVWDILSMFDALAVAMRTLKDATGIDESLAKFAGFDEHTELSYLAYCRFICSPGSGRFERVGTGFDRFNSHFPVLDSYRRMLAEYKGLGSPFELSKEWVIRVTSARPHPSVASAN
jgi:uncharacterized protein YfbU (UPF0304 family)